MKQLSFIPYTKKFLAQVLGVSNPTLTRYLNVHKTELLNSFPEYSATDKRLHPELFKFVCANHGVSNEQIAETIREIYPEYKEVSIDRIYGFFGLR
jgi:hypothetical protein